MNKIEWDLVFERDPLFTLDTCILVSALKSSRGASNYLLARALEGALPIVISTALLYEYEEVLLRPENIPPNATRKDILNIIDGLLEVAKPITIKYGHRPSLRDADDEFVLEAAYSAGAVIVTYNEGLFWLRTVRGTNCVTRKGCQMVGVTSQSSRA